VPHSNCSVCQPPTTSFSDRPIGTIAALSRMLKHPIQELEQIAATADQRYRIGRRELKKDGTWRICYDALGVLKGIQARIQCLILNKVHYPIYLQGSIKDPISPRGQKANACLHVRKRVLISEDIKQFFPSVSSHVVFDIWHRFFKFPPPVAEILTKLTTKEGALPQGTKTSALLANLVFWEFEWRLVADFHGRGITYSRLIDDITCSTARDLILKKPLGLLKPCTRWCGARGCALAASRTSPVPVIEKLPPSLSSMPKRRFRLKRVPQSGRPWSSCAGGRRAPGLLRRMPMTTVTPAAKWLTSSSIIPMRPLDCAKLW